VKTGKCWSSCIVLIGLVSIVFLPPSLGFVLPKASLIVNEENYVYFGEKCGTLSSSIDSTIPDGNPSLVDQGTSISIRKYKHKGWNLSYLYKPPSPGNEMKAPIVLIHPVGIGLSSWFWEKLMEEYGSQEAGGNPAIYAVDLIGCGLENGSDKWDPEEEGLFFPLSWVQGVETLIQSVVLPECRKGKKDQSNSSGCVVVVQGGIANVGVMLASRNPGSVVSRLIMTSPPIFKDMINPVPQDELERNYNFLRSKIWGGLAFALLETRPIIRIFSNLILFKEECDESWLDKTINGAYVEARTPIQAFNAGLLNHRSFEEELSTLEQPVLVLSGSSDKRNEDRNMYATKMKNCTMRVLDGLNVLPYENARDTVEAIEKFSN